MREAPTSVGPVSDLARFARDKAATKALEKLGRRLVGPYGSLLGVRLDSRARSLEVDLLLKGEEAPVTLSVLQYSFHTEEGRLFVRADRVTASREWMATLAEGLLLGRRYEIPGRWARLVEALA